MNSALKVLLIVLSLIWIIILVLAFSNTDQDPHIYLLLEELDGLKAGNEVIFRELPIGYVEEIDLFEKSPNEQTYFLATVVIQKDKFKHLYREMHFKVQRTSLIDSQKQLLIDDKEVVALNRLQRNEYVFGYSPEEDFLETARKIFKEIERDTKPLRKEIASQVKTGFRNMIRQIRPSTPDTTTS